MGADDQLILESSGLLRHRCTFPQCDHYLEKLMTAKDERHGTRHGLFKHLKYAVWPNNYYIPLLHKSASATLTRSPKIARDVFIRSMHNKLDGVIGSTVYHADEIDRIFGEVWDSYQR